MILLTKEEIDLIRSHIPSKIIYEYSTKRMDYCGMEYYQKDSLRPICIKKEFITKQYHKNKLYEKITHECNLDTQFLKYEKIPLERSNPITEIEHYEYNYRGKLLAIYRQKALTTNPFYMDTIFLYPSLMEEEQAISIYHKEKDQLVIDELRKIYVCYNELRYRYELEVLLQKEEIKDQLLSRRIIFPQKMKNHHIELIYQEKYDEETKEWITTLRPSHPILYSKYDTGLGIYTYGFNGVDEITESYPHIVYGDYTKTTIIKTVIYSIPHEIEYIHGIKYDKVKLRFKERNVSDGCTF